jgi:hypothetical protein
MRNVTVTCDYTRELIEPIHEVRSNVPIANGRLSQLKTDRQTAEKTDRLTSLLYRGTESIE